MLPQQRHAYDCTVPVGARLEGRSKALKTLENLNTIVLARALPERFRRELRESFLSFEICACPGIDYSEHSYHGKLSYRRYDDSYSIGRRMTRESREMVFSWLCWR